jgi:hypothetical protein
VGIVQAERNICRKAKINTTSRSRIAIEQGIILVSDEMELIHKRKKILARLIDEVSFFTNIASSKINS